MASLYEALIGDNLRVRLRFLPNNDEVTVGALVERANSAARWLNRTGSSRVAAALETSMDAIALLLATVLIRGEFASLPLPGRSESSEHYRARLAAIVHSCKAELVVVPDDYLGLAAGLAASVCGYADIPHHPVGVDAASTSSSFRLIQFSSGSTRTPQGVVLEESAIQQSLRAMANRVELESGDVACSWLPLTHDMGLMGMVLMPLWASNHFRLDGLVVLLDPLYFLRHPGSWLSACSSFGATITATPPFALSLVRRATAPSDLGRLRTCIVGGDLLHGSVLDRFSTELASSGLSSGALRPAYGMAEAGLAVSMTAVGAVGEPGRRTSRGLSVVSSGTPVDSCAVRVLAAPGDPEATAVGQLQVSGPMLASRYVDGTSVLDDDGWFETGDVGMIQDGQVFVLGRHGDRVKVAGRSVMLSDIDRELDRVPGVRTGVSTAFRVTDSGDAERVAVVFECSDGAVVTQTARAVAEHVLAECGVRLTNVLGVERGSVPKTASGKRQRRQVEQRYSAGELEILGAWP